MPAMRVRWFASAKDGLEIWNLTVRCAFGNYQVLTSSNKIG